MMQDMSARKTHPPNNIAKYRIAAGISQKALGQVLGIGPGAMSHKETGKSPVTTSEIEKLANALDCQPEDLIDSQAPNIRGYAMPLAKQPIAFSDTKKLQSSNKKLPEFIAIYGPAAAGSESVIRLTDEHIKGFVPRPPELSGVVDAFRMYVDGNSMEPRHFAGEEISIHPHKAPSIGGDCVLVMREDGNAVLKRYMGATDTHYKLMQWNPKREFTIKKSDVERLYAVVR